MPKVITITQYAQGERGVGGYSGHDVQHGDLIADGLTLGEMLEQVLGILQPNLRTYPMATRDEIAIRANHDLDDLLAPCDDWSASPQFEFDPLPF